MKKHYDGMVIGVVGGMGSYATLHFFQRFLDATPAEKEWDRPRIIIDNHCTMPSRVRAILYKEERPALVKLLADSIRLLLDAGATHIILACNTSHVFLDEIYDILPEAREKIVHIIASVAEAMEKKQVKRAGFIATEGTIQSGIFESVCGKYGIELLSPEEQDFPEMRYLIEAVKHNDITEEICERFSDLVKKQAQKFLVKDIILGCTEFPPIYEKAAQLLIGGGIRIWDPLEETLRKILL